MQEDSLGLAVNALDRVVSFLKPPASSKIKSSIVALYSAQSQSLLHGFKAHQLRFSDYDRKDKNYFLRLYHLQRLTLLLEVQLYYGFTECYRAHEQNPSLYYFQYLQEGHFAFLFRTAHEALIFEAKLKEIAPKQSMFRELKIKEKEEEEKAKQGNSFFGRVKGFFQKKQDTAKQESKIVQIRKSSAIMFDNSGSIITENISPEWLQIITNSGLRKADLKKPQIVQTILQETLIYEAARASIKEPSLFGQGKIKQLQSLKFSKDGQQRCGNSPILVQAAKEINSQQRISLKQAYSPQNNLKQQQTIKIEKIQQIQPNLPIPPPINVLFNQSQIKAPSNTANRNQKVQTARSNLLQEIRTNKMILKPVKTKEGGHIQIDASTFNKEDRKDLGEQIRLRLQRRAINVRKRKDSDEDSQQ